MAPSDSARICTCATSRWSTVAKWVAAAVSVISVAVGVVTVLPILFPNASGVNTVALSASDTTPDLVRIVPVTALTSFPIGLDDGCDAAQLEWLRQVGSATVNQVQIDLRNTAAKGAIVSVTDVAGEGAPPPSTTDAVLIDCRPITSIGNSKSAIVQLNPGSGPGYFDNSTPGTETEHLPDSPIGYNLAPGESAQFTLTITSAAGFEGALVAVVRSGADAVVTPIAVDGIEQIVVPASSASPVFLMVEAGSLRCFEPDVRAQRPLPIEGCSLLASSSG